MRSTNLGALGVLVGLLVLGTAGWALTTPRAVDATRLAPRSTDGWMMLGNVPFSGQAVQWHENGALAERVNYSSGQKDGPTERWYADGERSYRASYRLNKRHGTVQTWWEDGTPRSESNYALGVADGIQRQWYRTGAPFKELRLEQGREAGLQRAWRENGKLYANYEARDGRIFGLKRANLCYELDDESIVVGATADPSQGPKI